MLPERDHWRTIIQGVEDTFRREGAGPAGQVLTAGFGISGGEEDGGEQAENDAPPRDPATASVPVQGVRPPSSTRCFQDPDTARFNARGTA
jgi:hypothetical protein